MAVLLDDSRSMQIPDWSGMPRGEFVKQQFGAPESALLKALSDRFLVRVFRFSSTAGRLESAANSRSAGRRRGSVPRSTARAKSSPAFRCQASCS